MSKCPICNAEMVWKGSMLDGGLECPLECETALPPKPFNPVEAPKPTPYAQDPYFSGPKTPTLRRYTFKVDSAAGVTGDLYSVRCDMCFKAFAVNKYLLGDWLNCTCGNSGFVHPLADSANVGASSTNVGASSKTDPGCSNFRYHGPSNRQGRSIIRCGSCDLFSSVLDADLALEQTCSICGVRGRVVRKH